MSHMDERPRINLRLEVSLPDMEGGPAKKFCVTRAFKSRWSNNAAETMANIIREIKDYKGSYIGDMMLSLSSIVQNEEKITLPENVRARQVEKWTAAILERLVYGGIQDKMHRENIEDFTVQQWDGEIDEIQEVTPDELSAIDIDKVLLLLGPKLKHAVALMSKDMRRQKKINK